MSFFAAADALQALGFSSSASTSSSSSKIELSSLFCFLAFGLSFDMDVLPGDLLLPDAAAALEEDALLVETTSRSESEGDSESSWMAAEGRLGGIAEPPEVARVQSQGYAIDQGHSGLTAENLL